jgi:hypothetical protein
MARVLRGQRDLIDFAEVQHQDTAKELRDQVAALERQARLDAEYIRQLRANLAVWTEIVGQIPDKQKTNQVSQLWRRSIELCGIPDAGGAA